MRRTIAIITAGVTLTAVGNGFASAGGNRTATASVQGPVIYVRSKPYFPVMLIDQCTSEAVARAHSFGINTILNEHCSTFRRSAS